MRQAIAAAMSRSNREIPHFYVAQTIDMSRALAWLTEANTERPVTERLLYGVLLLKAVALALREVPELNGFWQEGRPERSEAVHVGVAVSLRGGGLVAPALHDTDKKSLDELMAEFRDLVQRARAGSLRSSELADPTITVTSLGEQGVEGVFGLIFPPQVAIVGLGKIVERPWAAGGRALRPPGLPREPRRRSPRRRRPPRRPLPRSRRPPPAETRGAVSDDELRETVLRVLGEIVPEADPASIEPDVSFRDQLDIDSMDFLNFAIALHEELGVEIPEADYAKLETLDHCVEYLERSAGTD